MTNAPAWERQRSVDADVSVLFAWQYMTNVQTGATRRVRLRAIRSEVARYDRMPGQPPNSWVIRNVDPGKAYTIAIAS